MSKRTAGFTLVELLITMAILGFVLAGTSQMVVSILRAHRQQSRIAETNIEGIIGLELLRQDLGKAGFGLPWNGLTGYTEVGAGNNTFAISLNDASPNPPKAITSVNNLVTGSTGILDGTDYLAIKATSIATNKASGKWMFLPPGAGSVPTSWTPATEDLDPTDRVIVLSPGFLGSPSQARTLILNGTDFYSQENAVANFADTSVYHETRIVYGVDSTYDLMRPFNRADYYVKQPTTGMPQRCAAGTGILYKAVLNQSDANLGVPMPLLDCVADMQVIYRRDLDNDGSPENWTEDISASSAQDIHNQVKEVRVFILAHEGQKDTSFTYPASMIHVGDTGYGRDFIFANHPSITDWQNYRWKIYTLVVQLYNLQ